MALSFIALCLASPALAEGGGPRPVSCAALIDRGRDYDGKEILFEGEAIGEPMRRGEHAWVNVLDASGAMGAWMPAADLATFTHYGSYREKGDLVRLRGVFHRACPDHGGDMDIHVESVEPLERGGAVAHPVGRARLALVPLSLLAAAGLYWFWRRRERR
jgi:hypothetical protein